MEKKETWQPIETADKNNSMSVDLWVSGKFNFRIADARWVDGKWCHYRLEDSGYGSLEMLPIFDDWQECITHWRDYPNPPQNYTRESVK